MTDTETLLITPMQARHVLWHLREPGGIEPGSFLIALMAAMAAADPANLRRLGRGFPGYAAAMQVALGSERGVTVLQGIAGVRLCPRCAGAGVVTLEQPMVEGGDVRHLDTCPDCRGRGTCSRAVDAPLPERVDSETTHLP